jgi:hypothetical protein
MGQSVRRHFACPNCLRLTTKMWDAAWCACVHAADVQAFVPSDEGGELAWTRMIEVPPEAIVEFMSRGRNER